jgi:retron-type reverse transcriptase
MGFFDRLVQRLFGRRAEVPTTPTPAPPAPAPAQPQAPTAPRSPGPPAPIPEFTTGDFLPISRDELAVQAKDVRLGGAWFGRRDLIPPADDPRTKLIDRGMVTHGLLTPEQLTEIHTVGAQMEKYRKDDEAMRRRAGATAEEAVKAERERKAQLKAQKKAEAAERKKRHAEGVAHRRATDIVFVGRGVSGRLNERTSDAAKLEAAGLPVLCTPAELAKALGLTIPKLRWLCFHTEAATRTHYVQFTVPKKSGGSRTLSAPHRTLAAAQCWVLDNVLAHLPAEPAAHGFLPGRSIVTNAAAHSGRGIVVNCDLEGFFPNITLPRVRRVFERLGYSPAVATLLALLCTECPRQQVTYAGTVYHVATGPRGLPQGACTSPALSNQVARRLDRRLQGLSKKLGLTYTRYADDLTFSGPAEFNAKVGYLLARVRHIARAEGFAVNEKKTRVLRQNTAQMVTGLVVNDTPGVRRSEVRRLRAILHRAKREGLDAQNRTGRANFRAWLRGKIAYVGMSRPEVGATLRAALEMLEG